MIPLLTQAPHITQTTLLYLQALKSAGFTGDIATDYASCLTMATDNSIYQLLPQAILFPRTTADVVHIMNVAQQTDFDSITFTARGGGTGTNGQSLNCGMIIDLSRYMNHILELNLKEGWVRVEAGVIKDQLNQFLKPHGYFFSPELSTSNRATLGGMINTDASGQGSRVYGKTSDHVLSLTSVLYDGETLITSPLSLREANQLAQQNSVIGQIYHQVLHNVTTHRALILEKYATLNRFFTGYDLRHVLSDDEQHVDLSRLLTGSEGTLAVITEAKLNITKLPKYRYLININYTSFDSALRHAAFLLNANALSVETMDSSVINLAREDVIWQSVSHLVTDENNHHMQGINIVEFAGHDLTELKSSIAHLIAALTTAIADQTESVIGYQLCDNITDIERVYAMRKKAVGLLGNSKGNAKPIPFVEDTAVPPEHLADYIGEFRQLLDHHQLKYGMFGHVDVGVLHVRPALDMCDQKQTEKIKIISDQIVALTRKYGGLLWGEHGKGIRSEYNHAYLGDTLYHAFRAIKTAFDPLNRLNPGKICTTLDHNETTLYQVDQHFRGEQDKQVPIAIREHYQGAFSCNGNGLCFQFDTDAAMCPSMKVTKDRRHSPKGRAVLLREWLRLISNQQPEKEKVIKHIVTQTSYSPVTMLIKWKNSWQAKKGQYDFSHEVKEAMDGCLSCKACATQCPIKVDIPALKSQFLQRYHGRYLRPLKDHVIGQVESIMPLLAKMPQLTNLFLNHIVVQKITERLLGVVNLPLLSVPTLTKRVAHYPSIHLSLKELAMLTPAQQQEHVLILQDAFTSYYDAEVVSALIELVAKLGFKPVLLPFKANGKALHVKGFLHRFAKTATKLAHYLNKAAALNIPIIGLDPALVQSYRDEYVTTLQQKRGDFTVLFVQDWLSQQIERFPQRKPRDEESWYLLSHCTESSFYPTAHTLWQALFVRLGSQLKGVSTGCCGMAGMYGHEREHQQTSRELYTLSWEKALQHYSPQRCLATGYSCRSQVKRFDKKTLQHPVQILLRLLKNN